ncbi:MAG: putative zinc protease [Gemmatimonadaceae bacterium]|nr:putative zinc protease [Gemmatimonadaceae bacterium]
MFELDNGLRVTVSSDHTTPIVAVNLWYHVGSANERPGRTGFAHLFEHMLFQGSANVGANEHFEIVQRAGGTLNGSTWLDRTTYYETVPSHYLSLALWLESDRMGALLPAMTQEKLDTQRSVVKNERQWSMDNQPYGTWWERLPALCFPPSHPFHHSLIGSMEDLDAAKLSDVTEFFATYYTPDNAVLTIAGDVEPEHARALVEEHFGAIPRGKARPPLSGMELPAHFGIWQREVVPDHVALPRIFLAFRIPTFGTDDSSVAAVTSALLGLKVGSRLHRSLVRNQRKATSVAAFTFDLARGADLLVLDVTASRGISGQALEESVAREVDRLISDGVRPAEVERAIALLTTDYVSSLQSATSRADLISKYVTYLDDATRINAQIADYQRVDGLAVTQFVESYMTERNRASLLYVPMDAVGST